MQALMTDPWKAGPPRGGGRCLVVYNSVYKYVREATAAPYPRCLHRIFPMTMSQRSCGRWPEMQRKADRSNFGEPLDRVLVVPADSGFPCGRRLPGDVVRV